MINSLFIQNIDMLQTHSYLLGALGILVAVMLYFYQELVTSKNTAKIRNRFFFWIYGGLFVFLASEIPSMALINYLIENGINSGGISFLKVKWVTSIAYYLSFIPALIWMKVL